MSSGIGRGRGWLNLEKVSKNPGGLPTTLSSLTIHVSAAQVQNYTKLLQLFEQLDLEDDGILLNHKFKAILQRWRSDTNSNSEVEESFKYIYAQSRKSSSLAKKLVLMVSSYSFISAAVHEVKIRNLFVNHIQSDFENRIQMQTLLPNEFRNSLCMLTEFFYKARLSDGSLLKLLAGPIMHYLEMLLDSGAQADLELFASQLYLNGSNLKEECPKKIEELLMRVRQFLAKNSELTPFSRIWLLLSLDISYNQFSSLPSEVHKFYQEELGDAAMINFQGIHGVLCIETPQPTEILNNYENKIAVLNSSPSELALSISEPANNTTNHQQPQQQADKNIVFHENAECINDSRERIGRPILGVGARLQKNSKASVNWKDETKPNAANWESSEQHNSRSLFNPKEITNQMLPLKIMNQIKAIGNLTRAGNNMMIDLMLITTDFNIIFSYNDLNEIEKFLNNIYFVDTLS